MLSGIGRKQPSLEHFVLRRVAGPPKRRLQVTNGHPELNRVRFLEARDRVAPKQ